MVTILSYIVAKKLLLTSNLLGQTITAASSPVTITRELDSPDPDLLHEDINLEGQPLPVYPLPSKPFPVQMPHKIGSGVSSAMPLDRSGKKVRRWRTAHREIKGIAGGRWFARSWVGEKESEYSAAVAEAAAAVAAKNVPIPPSTVLAIPVMPAHPPPLVAPSYMYGEAILDLGLSASISAPGPLQRPSMSLSGLGSRGNGKIKRMSKALSVGSAGSSSRGHSTAPEPHAVRAPTKMRTTVLAPSPEPIPQDAQMS